MSSFSFVLEIHIIFKLPWKYKVENRFTDDIHYHHLHHRFSGPIFFTMKTPERWRALPRHALLVTIPNKKSF